MWVYHAIDVWHVINVDVDFRRHVGVLLVDVRVAWHWANVHLHLGKNFGTHPVIGNKNRLEWVGVVGQPRNTLLIVIHFR